MARHLLKCAERVKHGVCAALEVHPCAYGFSPALLRSSAVVFPPRRPEAAEALMGTQQHDCRCTVITDAEATAAAVDALRRDCRCAVVTDRGCRSAHGPAAGRLRNVRRRRRHAVRSSITCKYFAGDKSKLKAIKTWGVNHAAALV